MTIHQHAQQILFLACSIQALSEKVTAETCEHRAIGFLARQIEDIAFFIRETEGMDRVAVINEHEFEERERRAAKVN